MAEPGDVVREEDLPPLFRGHDLEVPYTPGQLRPTRERLRAAIEVDLARTAGTPAQRLAAAWTRVAELRLPRKAVPGPVLDAIEGLVMTWERYEPGGIGRYAGSLGVEGIAMEAARLRWMLAEVEREMVLGHPSEVVPTE